MMKSDIFSKFNEQKNQEKEVAEKKKSIFDLSENPSKSTNNSNLVCDEKLP